MHDADRLTGLVRRAWTAPHGGRDLPWDEFKRATFDQPLLPVEDEPEGLDIMVDVRHGPARGIVLAFVPAVLIWTGLIALLAKLFK